MIGYTRENMGLGRVTLVKVKSSQCAWTYRTVRRGVRIDAIITDFSKASDLVPHDRLLRKLTVSGVG
jgi:hypothetical protein